MAKTKAIEITPVKETHLKIELIGDSPLILHKKSRQFERSEVFKQSHKKGTKIPPEFEPTKNRWEVLITSVNWEKPITFHDEDCDLYNEDEWNEIVKTNRPCILSNAFKGSFAETFISFGYKDSTGKAGTDFKRGVNIVNRLTPVDFDRAEAESKLVPNNGISKTNVICSQNIFYNWKCELEITVADVVFPYQTVLELIATAGKYIGIGTARQNGNGRYHIGNIQILS